MTEAPQTPRLPSEPLQFGGRAKRPVLDSLLRGLRRKCPACGTGSIYRGYLKVHDRCPSCGEELFHQKADDAPPYFTILIVGHVLVPAAGIVERDFHPDMVMQMALWPTLALLMCLWLLPRVKGALIGVQWANYMHGFGGEDDARGPEAVFERDAGAG